MSTQLQCTAHLHIRAQWRKACNYTTAVLRWAWWRKADTCTVHTSTLHLPTLYLYYSWNHCKTGCRVFQTFSKSLKNCLCPEYFVRVLHLQGQKDGHNHHIIILKCYFSSLCCYAIDTSVPLYWALLRWPQWRKTHKLRLVFSLR